MEKEEEAEVEVMCEGITDGGDEGRAGGGIKPERE